MATPTNGVPQPAWLPQKSANGNAERDGHAEAAVDDGELHGPAIPVARARSRGRSRLAIETGCHCDEDARANQEDRNVLRAPILHYTIRLGI
jgi:hypothetical protein